MIAKYQGQFTSSLIRDEWVILEAAPVSIGTAVWGCSTVQINGTSRDLYAGLVNTQLIIEQCPTAGIAARLADAYIYGGKTDWYLPSYDEMEQMIAQKVALGITTGNYWTSNPNGGTTAFAGSFDLDSVVSALRTGNYNVRPVRSQVVNKLYQIGEIGPGRGIVFHVYAKPAPVHTITIYDREASTGDTQVITMEAPGYSLDYNSGITDYMIGGIIESECRLFIRNIDNALDDLLTGLRNNGENRYLVEISVDDSPKWRGVVITDFGKIEDSPYGGIRLTAVDGLALLQEYSADTTPLNYSNGGTLSWILTGLAKLPTADLWDEPGADLRFLFARTDWFAGEEMLETDEVLQKSLVGGTWGALLWGKVYTEEGYNGQEVTRTEWMNYRDVIGHILERFNCVLVMVDGAWHVYQRELLSSGQSVSFQVYRKSPYANDWQYGLTTPAEKNCLTPITENSRRYRAQGEFYHLPALKRVSVKYYAGDVRGGFGSLFPNGFRPGDTAQTFPLVSGGGNKLHIKLRFAETFPVTPAGASVRGYVNYKITVYNTAGYYLQSNGVSWALTPAYVQFKSFDIGYFGYGTPEAEIKEQADVYWSRITNELPGVEGELDTYTLKLERIGIVMYYGNTIPNTPYSAMYYFDPQHHWALYLEAGEYPTATALFASENNNDNVSSVYQLTDSLFGSVGQSCNGNTLIYPRGQVWRKGFSSAENDYFNQVLVDEVLAGQVTPLLVFSGDIIDRSYNAFDAWKAIRIWYKGYYYRMVINKVEYIAETGDWRGEWIEIARYRSEITHIDPAIDGIDSQIDDSPIPGNPVIPSYPFGIATGVLEIENQTIQTSQPVPGVTQLQADESGTLKQVDEYGNTKTVGTDAMPTEPDPAGLTPTGGFLYNWYVTQEAGLVSGVAWRVPLHSDFQTLVNYLIAEGFNYDDTTSGNKIGKAVGTASGWDASATAGAVGNTDYAAKRNITGLSILPAGQREITGVFSLKGESCQIWSATEYNTVLGRAMVLLYDSVAFNYATGNKGNLGINIRLCRDASVGEQALADGTVIADAYTGNDEKVYQGVKIGTQIWMSENLAESKYSDGSEIVLCPEASVWASLTIARRCAYDNDMTEAYSDANEIRWKDGKKMPDTEITSRYNIIAAEYTLTDLDSFVEASSGTFNVNLPTAVGKAGRKYTIINAGTGVITLTPNGAETISGDTSFSLNQWDAISIVSNGSNWRII